MRSDSDHIVVVGASVAGMRAVQSARELGFGGSITLVSAESHLPYDRPPLSKAVLAPGHQPSPPTLPDAERLTDMGIECIFKDPAIGLDVENHLLSLTSRKLDYDALLIATGLQPRRLSNVANLAGVHCLRTLDEAIAIRKALERRARIVIVGGSFIGSEVASAAREHELSTTIIDAMPTPLTQALGKTAGSRLTALHERNGTALRTDTTVVSILGDRHVEGVELSDGTSVPADLVIVGIGARPATAWLETSSLTLGDGLVSDSALCAGKDVWSAGDVTRWHNELFNSSMRVEHWTNAGDQGAHAMQNLLTPDEATPYNHVPYFWSDWYGQRIQFAGLPLGEPEVVTGAWSSHVFVALYRDSNRLAGALALNKRGDIMKYRTLIAHGGTWDQALDLASRRNAGAAVLA